MAENIQDYGAVPDDGTDDTQAIADAMDAAGANGTVYVPSGTYRIGNGSNKNDPLQCGDLQPAGISFYGDGPGKSIIKWSDAGNSSYERGIRWKGGYDHGTVTVTDMTWDGNYEYTEGTGFGFTFDGTGSSELHMKNVEWKRWWSIGGICRVGGATFKYCTFSENGIGADNTQESDGHGFNASHPSGEILAEDCVFEKMSGVAIDHTDNATGTVRMRRCHVENVGAGVLKNNPNTGTKYLEHVNASNMTGSWIRNNLVGDQVARGFYNVPPHSSAGDYVVDNVVFGNAAWPGVLVEESFDVSGDLLVIDNVNVDDVQPAAWHSNDGGNVSIDRLSIVNTTGPCFDLDGGASGSIKELNRQNNSGGLGDTGGVSIGTDNSGTAAHAITVPSKSEVGAYAGTSSSDTTSPSPSDETYGGYNQPGQGTLDWHFPLNENFGMIEEDVKSLDQRISDLESQL